jgi:cysteine synthase B
MFGRTVFLGELTIAMATAYNQPEPARTPSRFGTRILDLVGNTPLLRLEVLTEGLPGVHLLGKAEWTNPGGSVKDRAASAIVTAALGSGELSGGRRLLDSTSGNTGIAYAMLGAALNFPVTLCVPENVSPERKRILNAYGAEIIYTDPAVGSDGAMLKARELAAADPDKYYYADQYSNDNNWRAHYHGTANEIWQQTEGRVTHFVSMLGTTGTFVGATRRLKELNSTIQCISLQPDSPFHGIEGAKYLASSLVPNIYDPTLADANLEISTETAYDMCKRLARREGLLVGISAAAAIVGSLEVAKQCASRGEEAVIVTVLCDNADKYFSERFWEE